MADTTNNQGLGIYKTPVDERIAVSLERIAVVLEEYWKWMSMRQ